MLWIGVAIVILTFLFIYKNYEDQLVAICVDKIHLPVGNIAQQCQHDIPYTSTQEGVE